jgi:hypothetical protein
MSQFEVADNTVAADTERVRRTASGEPSAGVGILYTRALVNGFAMLIYIYLIVLSLSVRYNGRALLDRAPRTVRRTLGDFSASCRVGKLPPDLAR